jgi:hypothetical protein
MEHFKLKGGEDFEVEVLVNGVPAKVFPFFEAMGAEYDRQVEVKAVELLSQRFGDIQDLLMRLEDEMKKKLETP